MIKLIAFDADDTLWQNETHYAAANARLKQLLAGYQSADWVGETLFRAEVRAVGHYGYGIKGFILAMLDAALEVSEDRLRGYEVRQILEIGREMLQAEVQLLEGVQETLLALGVTYELVLITKGDLLEQGAKLERSGLSARFKHVEVVGDKTPEQYRSILHKLHTQPEQFVMVGNSLKSDILPVLEVGGMAVYIPHDLTWAHEAASEPEAGAAHFYKLERIDQLPSLIESLNV